ncbi:MAG TPA: response regulator [Roseiflexaceae bacterium]
MATRIMVVDDEPAIGKLLLYQLGGFGYQVSYIQDGVQALQRLLAERPDLVLLDVMMPRISGWEVCRQIRAYSSVPVILLTAKSADPDVVTGLDAGADDYVTKPFSMAQLHARIEAVLRRSAAVHSGPALVRANPCSDPHLTAPADPQPRDAYALPLESPPPGPSAPPVRLGQHIREARLARALTLHQVERACKIRWEFLQAIEQENWSYIPRAELRRALRGYTGYLGIDLPALIGRPKPRKPHPPFPLPFAAALAVVMVLLVVGMYLL